MPVEKRESLEQGGDEHYRRAFRKACDFLARRPHSAQQLSQKLQRNFSAETIDRVLEKLRDLRYLDDYRFAVDYAGQRLERSPRGAALLAAELRVRGVDQSLIQSALEAVQNESGRSEQALALRAARRKLAALKGLDEAACRAKLVRFLSSRGFSSATVYDVLKSLLD